MSVDNHKFMAEDYADRLGMTMYEVMKAASTKRPEATACSFFGCKMSCAKLLSEVDRCAESLASMGVTKGQYVTLALPNCPQAVILVYAVNKLGAVANMVHPLSSEKEIEYFVKITHSSFAVTFDMTYSKFMAVWDNLGLEHLVVTTPSDGLSGIKKFLYNLTSKSDFKGGNGSSIIGWSEFMKAGQAYAGTIPDRVTGPEDIAVVLYSGGTTGSVKGVMHTNSGFNSLSLQILERKDLYPSDLMMALMPVFHGFGLGVSVHTAVMVGMEMILIPRFIPDEFCKTLVKRRATIVVGIPSMYGPLMKNRYLANADLSQLTFIVSGGDTLNTEMQARVDKFFTDRGSHVEVSPGYGLSEAIGAICVDVGGKIKGSVGKAFEGNIIRVVAEDGTDMPTGEYGEIIVSGPTIMAGYLDNESETERVVKTDADGRRWLHTGDIGYLDEEGAVHYVQRLKRLIITNGYNVYPTQVETVFDGHPYVSASCAIGVPDKRKGQRVKVFVVLNSGVPADDSTRGELMAYARQNISKFALPSEIEFRTELPQTNMGKIAFRTLEKEAEELAKAEN